MKKTITILVLMLICGWANAAFDGGAGTLVSPYQVSTAAQLDDVRNNLSSYFIQTADIDLITYATGIGWIPIGNATTKFTGSYDGGGHKIKHLFINHGGTTYGDYSALFGYINTATIKNIGVECNVTGNSYTAGLVGEADGISTIQNCYSIGIVTGFNSTGGLVGYANFTAGSIISNCYSRAIVVGYYYAGGLVGEAWRVTFTNCYATGSVSGQSGTVGGLTGRNISCVNNNCFWDTEASGVATSLIGTGKTTAEMKTQATFTNWNFATSPIIWDIDAENSGYPHLHWQAFTHNKYYVKTTGSNSNDGSSWANAFLTFQKALETAQTGDQIWVASGTYKPSVQVGGTSVRFATFQMLEGVEIYGGFAGTEALISDRLNFGMGKANETILSGDLNGDDNYSGASWSGTSENCYHVVYNSGNLSYLTSAATLDGFTIKGGYGSQYGGGLVNDGASPTIRNCIITYNQCYTGGGGVYNNSGNTCKPTYTNCLVINNISSKGAGVWCRAAFPTFINTTIANNTSSTDGSALWSGMGGNTTFNNCILWGNTGGASSTGKQIWSDGIVYLNYSCYSNGTSANSGTITPSNSITTDPIIMNVSKNDYRIVGLSPCLDAGSDAYNSLTTDVRGKTFGRKLLKTDSTTVGTIDMGAYEFKSGFDSINPCTGPVVSSQSTGTQTLCLNGTFTSFTVYATATNSVLTYQWYSSATADTTSGTTIGTNSNSYTPLATVAGTKYYYCKVSGDCGSPKKSTISGAIITNALPVPTISGNTSACINSTGNVYTTQSSMTGYSWNIVGGTGTTPDNIATVTWNASGAKSISVNYTNGNGCNAATATVYNVTVFPLFTSGAIATTGETICYNGNPAIIGSTTVASGGNDTITYAWYKSTTNFTDSTLIVSNTSTYDPPTGLTTTTSYRRYAHESRCNTFFVVSSGTWTVTVNPASNGGNISGGARVCNDTNSTLLTLSGHTGNVVKWQYTADAGYHWYDISNTSTTYTATNLTTTTGYRAVVQSGVCSSTPGGYANVTVQSVVTAGTIATAQTICNNTAPVALTSATAGTGSNTITYEWQTNASGSYVNIGSATAATYQPPTLTATTSYQRRTVSTNGSNACYSDYTSPIAMTVYNAFAEGSITTTGETICYNTSPSTEIGNSTLASGGDNSISYSWKSSADGYISAISGANASTYTPAGPLTTTTSYQRYAKDNTCNTTPEVSTGTWTVTVRDNFTTGTIASTGESICYNTNPNTEIGNTTLASGGDNSITYEWRSSADSYATAISGANASTYTPAGPLTTTTSYQRYAKDNTCNITPEVSTGIWTVTVNPLPVPTVSGPTGICNNSADNVYTTESGKTSYVWTVPGGTITAGAGTNAITVTWNNDGAQTISINYANSFGCVAPSATVYNVNVKAGVNPSITGTPSNAYVVHALDTIQYCTPYVYGHLYSWSGFGQVSFSSSTARNCINDYLCNPCGIYGAWTISVIETNPVTGCSATATKNIFIQTP